jgi:cytosine deaminase
MSDLLLRNVRPLAGPATDLLVQAGRIALAEAVATRSPKRRVVKAGRIVARDGVLA